MVFKNNKGVNYMFNIIEEVIEDIKNGKMVIVVDDESRENEGDLLMVVEMVIFELINFMVIYGRGLICLFVIEKKFKSFNIFFMVRENIDIF